jgi:hypothetical protein
MKRLVIGMIVFLACVGIGGEQKKGTQVVNVQVVFTEYTNVGTYTDAIYFTQDAFAKLKQEDLDTIKKARVDAWVERIKNPPPPVEPTAEELDKQAVALQSTITALQSELTAVQTAANAKRQEVKPK